MNEQGIMGQISNHIVEGQLDAHIHQQDSRLKSKPGISELIRLSLKKNVPASLISADALNKAMYKSIKKYEEGQFLLPELIDRAKSTTKARNILAKFAGDDLSLSEGTAVLATIYGEDHTQWRDITASILKGLGIKTIDLGASASIEDIVHSVKHGTPDLLGITMPTMSVIPEVNAMTSRVSISEITKVIHTLSEEGCRENMKVLIGGNAGEIESAEAIGADYYCNNVFQTIVLLNSIYNSPN